MKKIKLAIIGCGKVTETFHLPASSASEDIEVTALVDTFLPQARSLATKYEIPIVEDDYRNILGKVDAAIVAIPHHLHGSVGLDLLQNNIHVLVEKPMALTKIDCDKMIRQAERSDLILAVGLLRRFYEATKFIQQLLEKNMLGRIISFDFREGLKFSWNSTSDFMFRKFAGGGVMVDTGIHVLDTLLWWLGDYEEAAYYDDAMGGVEANAEVHLLMQNGAKGVVELSRTRNLRNSCIIKGEHGSLEVGLGVNPMIKLQLDDKNICFNGYVQKDRLDKNNKDVFIRQLADFTRAILNHKPPFISGSEGRRSVEILETCYASKQQLHEPWMLIERESL